jgi:hypothetical protein
VVDFRKEKYLRLEIYSGCNFGKEEELWKAADLENVGLFLGKRVSNKKWV